MPTRKPIKKEGQNDVGRYADAGKQLQELYRSSGTGRLFVVASNAGRTKRNIQMPKCSLLQLIEIMRCRRFCRRALIVK